MCPAGLIYRFFFVSRALIDFIIVIVKHDQRHTMKSKLTKSMREKQWDGDGRGKRVRYCLVLNNREKQQKSE